MAFFEKHKASFIAQAASLSILGGWYPFFAKSMYERSQIIASKSPGDLSHSTSFRYYRGLSANLLLQPLFPLTNSLYTKIVNEIETSDDLIEKRPITTLERVGASFMVGASTSLVANPYEVLILASQKNKTSPYNAAQIVFQQSGMKGFYTGTIPTAIRNGLFYTSIITLVPTIKKSIDPWMVGSGPLHETMSTIVASTIPACLFLSVAVPIDLAAMMRQSDPSRQQFTSGFHAIQCAYKKHGIASLKTGLRMRLLGCIIEFAGFNLFYDFYSSLV